MKKVVITKSGRKVYVNYLDNIICADKTNEALVKKANSKREEHNKGVAKGLSRFGSFNSEDALSWSVFRSLELNSGITYNFFDLLGVNDELEESIFWGINTKTEKIDLNLEKILNLIEPKRIWKQQTEPDIILRCKEHIILIESKLGCFNERILGWSRQKELSLNCQRYKLFLADDFNPIFSNNYNTLGKKYYQLMRNIIIGRKLAEYENKKFLLIALINPFSKPIGEMFHKSKFENFLTFLKDPSLAKLLTWQEIGNSIPEENEILKLLKKHLNEHPCLIKK